MKTKKAITYQIRIYMSGPIEVAKQALRKYVRCGLCVTIEPTLFIYTGGEETGFVVGLLNYPRFPDLNGLQQHAENIAKLLIDATEQDSALIVAPHDTIWYTKREAA